MQTRNIPNTAAGGMNLAVLTDKMQTRSIANAAPDRMHLSILPSNVQTNVIAGRMSLTLAPENPQSSCMTGTVARGTTGFILGSLLMGGMQAASGAVAGAVGAAILQAAENGDYSVQEATQMGALGNGIMGAAVGACIGTVLGLKSSQENAYVGASSDKQNNKYNFFSVALSYVSSHTLAGVIGWAIMNNNAETLMSLGQTAAALASGSAATMIPVICVIHCIALPIVLACIVCADKDNDLEVGPRA